jgi:DNA-binding transcriptional regulator YhcF (GntR family)
MPQRDAHHFTNDDQRAVDAVSDVIDVSVINPRSMLPAYLQLTIYLRGLIIVRQLPPGSPLPSEPDLAERYGVSRDTVRRAIQVLREIGLAETRRGIGHFVTRTPEIHRVEVAPGSRVVVRMPQPHEQGELLGLTVFVVTEPGKPPVAYDTAQTLLVFPDEVETTVPSE